MRRRVAFVTNLCPHYRRALYELLAQRWDVDFYFHSDGSERYLSGAMRSQEGAFRTVDLRRFNVRGQVIQPGLARRLRSGRYDAVVKCLNGKLMVPYTFAAARASRLPFVLWTGMWYHPQSLVHRLTRPATSAVYRGADSVVVYGDHVRRYVEEQGVDTRKIFVAGQAVDASLFADAQPPFGEPPTVLYVGQLEERKGIDVLLEAVARARTPLHLRFAGGGSLEPLLRGTSADVLGHVPQDRLRFELERAWCLVLPSVTTRLDREPWGLVVNEAMTAGIPVVASDAVGAAAGGLVVDGRNGFVVPEGDAAALAQALDRLAGDAELARRLGTQARVDVARFNYPAMADAFDAAVEHAIAARSRGRALRLQVDR